MTVTIKITVQDLWSAYSGNSNSGRFACPITLVTANGNVDVTHIYRGYGATRLERIAGKVASKKGFQGEDVTPMETTFRILD
jgi:hypothetical protein